mmetsp:Transcript_3969/g.5795  ORF Transcript_3969/g.5795 Transcript_3969/m.5795 type:complete len:345 (-) Transcript_3969:13-1047(-)
MATPLAMAQTRASSSGIHHGEPVDAVVRLNNVGLTHLQRGKHTEAARCFTRALSRANGCAQAGTTATSDKISTKFFRRLSLGKKRASCPSSASTKSMMKSSTDDTNGMIISMNGSISDDELFLEDSPCCSMETTAQNMMQIEPAVVNNNNNAMQFANSNASTNNKNLYIYQRDEYDEGMYIYTSPVALDNTCCDHRIILSTVLYNLGQTHVRHGQYEEALGWFERCLTKTTLTESSSRSTKTATTAVNAVTVQHNIGHCNYRLGRYTEAMQYYQRALMSVHELVGSSSSSSGSDIDLAINMNCIAVLHFHNSTTEADKAMELFMKSLDIRRSVLGHTHRDVATV